VSGKRAFTVAQYAADIATARFSAASAGWRNAGELFTSNEGNGTALVPWKSAGGRPRLKIAAHSQVVADSHWNRSRNKASELRWEEPSVDRSCRWQPWPMLCAWGMELAIRSTPQFVPAWSASAAGGGFRISTRSRIGPNEAGPWAEARATRRRRRCSRARLGRQAAPSDPNEPPLLLLYVM
jgi:hypothetical protein